MFSVKCRKNLMSEGLSSSKETQFDIKRWMPPLLLKKKCIKRDAGNVCLRLAKERQKIEILLYQNVKTSPFSLKKSNPTSQC